MEDLNRAIAIDPKMAEAYFWRGQARNMLGDFEGSDKDLSKAIELDPGYADAYRIRGAFRERAGQRDNAIADYRKALELDPLSREARDAYKAASGDTADSVVKPIAPTADGWDIYRSASGSFTAVNDRYPKIFIPLEMLGDGNAAILEWTPLRDSLTGIGLLRYRAGERKGIVFESVVIIDLVRGQAVSIEPYLRGDGKSQWAWTQNAVTVTDHEGLSSYYELKKPRLAEPRNDDPFSFFSGRQTWRGGGGRGPGIFGWLFR
jgi:tetratricopeptide (TPR) repeat protein